MDYDYNFRREVDEYLESDYAKRRIKDYSTCHHVHVTCGYINDGDYDSSSIPLQGCIKCGLTTRAIIDDYSCFYFKDGVIMNKFLQDNNLSYAIDFIPGKQIGDKFTCINLDLAREMYRFIVKNYPNISDDDLVNVFTRWLSKYYDNKDQKFYKWIKR